MTATIPMKRKIADKTMPPDSGSYPTSTVKMPAKPTANIGTETMAKRIVSETRRVSRKARSWARSTKV